MAAAHILFLAQYHGIGFVYRIFSQYQQIFLFVAVGAGAVLSEIQRLPGYLCGVVHQHSVKAHDAHGFFTPEGINVIIVQEAVLKAYVSKARPEF